MLFICASHPSLNKIFPLKNSHNSKSLPPSHPNTSFYLFLCPISIQKAPLPMSARQIGQCTTEVGEVGVPSGCHGGRGTESERGEEPWGTCKSGSSKTPQSESASLAFCWTPLLSSVPFWVRRTFPKCQRDRIFCANCECLQKVHHAVLPDFSSLALNASNFLTSRDKRMINPIFGSLSSRASQNTYYILGFLCSFSS